MWRDGSIKPQEEDKEFKGTRVKPLSEPDVLLKKLSEAERAYESACGVDCRMKWRKEVQELKLQIKGERHDFTRKEGSD